MLYICAFLFSTCRQKTPVVNNAVKSHIIDLDAVYFCQAACHSEMERTLSIGQGHWSSILEKDVQGLK